MRKFYEKIIRDYSDECITDAEIEMLLDVHGDSKYGQIKRAVQRGDLIRIRRGLYCLAQYVMRRAIHPFSLASKIYHPSYISLESALSYHGLIPEAVYTTTSVTTNRSKAFLTPLGEFRYMKLPHYDFYVAVESITENGKNFLIAKPWKAIIDYVYCYKKDWRGLDPLTNDLRIDEEDIPKTTAEELTVIRKYYENQRVNKFVNSIITELKL